MAVDRPKRIRALLRPRARDGDPAGRAPDWFRITNAADGTAELWIYDEIGWWGTTAEAFVGQLKAIAAPRIDLHINSPGGEVFDGLAIYNCLRAHPAYVTTYVDGLAASAASFIALAGDKVICARNAMMMIHDAAGLCWGNAGDMRELADLLDKLSNNIADIYTARAGGTVEAWRTAMLAETWYTGTEAVDAGLADEMTDPDPQAEPAPGMSNTWDLSIFRYAGREAAPAPAPVGGRGQAPAPSSGGAVEPPSPQSRMPLIDLDALARSLRPAATTTTTTTAGMQVTTTVTGQIAPAALPAAGAPADAAASPSATASPVHHTDTNEDTWDAGTQEGRLPSPMSVATAKTMYGWYDADQVEDGEITKSACKLPHHEVSADGTPGAAVLPGVRNALARLSQSDIPESEQDAVRSHLEAHLADGGGDEENRVDEPVDQAAGAGGDGWAASVAQLLQPRDGWAGAVAHLITSDEPAQPARQPAQQPSAVDEWTRMREALL